MKRIPLIANFLLFIVLCASAAYWVMRLYAPQARPVAAAPAVQQPELRLEAAAGLFGGRATTVASNFQLKGVIVAHNAADSVAILVTEGKPAQAVASGTEVVPGVLVKEVQARYVLLSDNGVIKRVELPENAVRVDVGNRPPVPVSQPVPVSSGYSFPAPTLTAPAVSAPAAQPTPSATSTD